MDSLSVSSSSSSQYTSTLSIVDLSDVEPNSTSITASGRTCCTDTLDMDVAGSVSSCDVEDHSTSDDEWQSDSSIGNSSSRISTSDESGSEDSAVPSEEDSTSHGGVDPSLHMPLYEGSKVTLIDCIILLVQFLLRYVIYRVYPHKCVYTIYICGRFSLSIVAFEALLKLIAALLPQSNRMVKSYYMIKKWCYKLFPDINSKRHIFCKKCLAPVTNMPCRICGESAFGNFLIANIENQIKERFKGRSAKKCSDLWSYNSVFFQTRNSVLG